MSDWHTLDTIPHDRVVELTVWNDNHKKWLEPKLVQWTERGISGIPDAWVRHPMRWADMRAMPSRPHSNEFSYR